LKLSKRKRMELFLLVSQELSGGKTNKGLARLLEFLDFRGANGFIASDGKLAEQFGLNRSTIKRAKKVLVECGLITTHSKRMGKFQEPTRWTVKKKAVAKLLKRVAGKAKAGLIRVTSAVVRYIDKLFQTDYATTITGPDGYNSEMNQRTYHNAPARIQNEPVITSQNSLNSQNHCRQKNYSRNARPLTRKDYQYSQENLPTRQQMDAFMGW